MPQIPSGFGQNRGILFFAEDSRIERSAALVRHLFFISPGKDAGQENGRFLAAKATRQDEKTGVR
jgi:hypothetical protein